LHGRTREIVRKLQARFHWRDIVERTMILQGMAPCVTDGKPEVVDEQPLTPVQKALRKRLRHFAQSSHIEKGWGLALDEFLQSMAPEPPRALGGHGPDGPVAITSLLATEILQPEERSGTRSVSLPGQQPSIRKQMQASWERVCPGGRSTFDQNEATGQHSPPAHTDPPRTIKVPHAGQRRGQRRPGSHDHVSSASLEAGSASERMSAPASTPAQVSTPAPLVGPLTSREEEVPALSDFLPHPPKVPAPREAHARPVATQMQASFEVHATRNLENMHASGSVRPRFG